MNSLPYYSALFSTEILEKLKEKNVTTPLHFMRENPQKLQRITELTFKQIIEIRSDISHTYRGKMKTGIDLYLSEQSLEHRICSTGIQRFDHYLRGGLKRSTFYEFCSTSISKAVDLCEFIIVYLVSTISNVTVYYFDTKGSFSAQRIYMFFYRRKIVREVIFEYLRRIKVIRCWNEKELISSLHETKNELCDTDLNIVFVDSITTAYFQNMNLEHQRVGFALINHLAATLKYLCLEKACLVFATNIATEWSENRLGAKPTMGKYWQHVPHNRFIIYSVPGGQLRIVAAKCEDIGIGSECVVSLAYNDGRNKSGYQ